MDRALFEEMLATDCWDGAIVFAARGDRYDLLPNPAFGFYPDDCPKKAGAIFFTATTVSLLIQTSVDDATIAIEDSLDTISSIVAHELPYAKAAPPGSTTTILEFRCLHSRFWFGSVEGERQPFAALPRVLAQWSPGISYDSFVAMSLGVETLATSDAQFAWTPPPPSEPPPAQSTGRRSLKSRSSRKSGNGNGNDDSAGGRTVETAGGTSRTGATADSTSSSSSSSTDSDDSDAAGTTSSWGYTSATRAHRNFARTRLRLGGDGDDDDGDGAARASLSLLQARESHSRGDVAVQCLCEFAALTSAMHRECMRVMLAHVEAVHSVNTSSLDSRSSFLIGGAGAGGGFAFDGAATGVGGGGGGAPWCEEPAGDAVRSFLEDLEKSVRVRMKQYLAAGAGPAVVAQRQQAEAAAMYRSLADQVERLKAQNAALSVHLAQERRHAEGVEAELAAARADLSQARAREHAVLSRMRRREADWSVSGAPDTQLHLDVSGA